MSSPSLAGLALSLWLGCLLPGPWWLAILGTAALALAAGLARRRRWQAWVVAVLALALLGAGLTGGRLAVAQRGPLSALADGGGAADLEARVVTEARPTARGAWLLVRVTAVDGEAARQRALLEVDDMADAPPLGAVVATRATAQPLDRDGFHGHTRRLGAVARLTILRRPEVVAVPPRLLAASTRMRERAGAAFHARLDHERAVLLSGLTTGDVRDRPDGQRERFAAAGLSHLVVVSGKHTALMLAGVLGLCAILGAGARERRLAGLAALAWFVVLVRWQPSVLRAGGMAALVLVAGLLGRGRAGGRLLWVAVLLLLLGEPLLAGRLGFALSVLATAGVLLVAPRIVPRLRGPAWLRWTAAATVGAQMGVAPILMAADGAVPPAALPANLVAGPAAAVGQATGLLAGMVAQVSVPAAARLAELAGPFLSVILWSAGTFGDLPVLEPRHLRSPAAVLLGLAVLLRRRRVLAAVLLVLAGGALAAPSWTGPRPVSDPTVTVFDVGQGDALLVEVPGERRTVRMLFDGGPDPDRTVRLLRERRIRRLDVVAMSHGHRDHAAGLPAVLSALDVGVVVIGATPDPRHEPPTEIAGEVLAAASTRGVPVRLVADGDRFTVGGAVVTALNPRAGGDGSGDLHAHALVLRLDGPGGSVLLTGDVEAEAQRRLLRRPGRLAVDVLQVPHHGAATNAVGFLRRTGASMALISVGADNEYGHPTPAVLADLAGATVLRTDQDGTVRVRLTADGPVAERRRRRGIGHTRGRRHDRATGYQHARIGLRSIDRDRPPRGAGRGRRAVGAASPPFGGRHQVRLGGLRERRRSGERAGHRRGVDRGPSRRRAAGGGGHRS